VERTCNSCGRGFSASRSDARFCGPTCRKRATRGAVRSVTELRPAQRTGLVAAARSELEAAGRMDSLLGQSVLALAERLESGVDTGAAFASLNRELRATLEQAKAGTKVERSPLQELRDELAARRRRLA
jgi:uncharacterized OB-fold protein